MKKYKLGEILDVKRGASLAGEYYSATGKYVRLTCGNFDYINNTFKINTSKENLYYTGQVRDEFIMKKGDIITPLTEQAIGLLGSTAIIPEDDKYIQSQDIAKIICKEGLLYPMYAYYLISSKAVKMQLSAAAQQTKIRHTSPDKIKDCVVWIPELEKQKRIASILSSLDKKIALNHAINRNLEALAKQLYDYWFVQFDFPNEDGKPYKSSGGAMVYNEDFKRYIPKEWKYLILNNWLEIKSGFPFSSDTFKDEGKYKIITIKNVQDGFLDTSGCDFIDELPIKSKDYIKLNVGDCLISLTGNCGRLCIVTEQYLLLNQRVGVICCKDPNYKEFAYQLFRSEYIQAICENLANGAAQANLSPIELCKCHCVLPTKEIIEIYNHVAIPIRDTITKNTQVISNLIKLRDELLPLLMNGQVSVNS